MLAAGTGGSDSVAAHTMPRAAKTSGVPAPLSPMRRMRHWHENREGQVNCTDRVRLAHVTADFEQQCGCPELAHHLLVTDRFRQALAAFRSG